MNVDKPGQIAAITGTASGLGRALCLALARRGWQLAMADINEPDNAETLGLVEQAGGSGRIYVLDTSDETAVGRWCESVYRDFGRCDLLVNNAGVAGAGNVGDASTELWRWTVGIDLMGPIWGCHYFVPRMKAQGAGYVVNVASIAGYANAPGMGPYNVSKAGVISLSETLRAEVGDVIGVTVVCPSFFKTNIARDGRTTDPSQERVAKKLVEQSKISADTIAEAVVRGIARRQPYVIPQQDAKAMWRIRRLAPSQFTELSRVVSKRLFR